LRRWDYLDFFFGKVFILKGASRVGGMPKATCS
jgi:hypothetical protein